MFAKHHKKLTPLLLVCKATSVRQTPVRVDAIENLQNVEMGTTILLQDYQVTKNMF